MQNDGLWPYPQIDAVATAAIVVDNSGRRLLDEGLGGISITNDLARLDDPLCATVICDAAIWDNAGRAAQIPPNPQLDQGGGTLHRAETIDGPRAQAAASRGGVARHRGDLQRSGSRRALAAMSPPRSAKSGVPKPIETPPFYAIPICAGITNTLGGIAIDGHGRVRRRDGRHRRAVRRRRLHRRSGGRRRARLCRRSDQGVRFRTPRRARTRVAGCGEVWHSVYSRRPVLSSSDGVLAIADAKLLGARAAGPARSRAAVFPGVGMRLFPAEAAPASLRDRAAARHYGRCRKKRLSPRRNSVASPGLPLWCLNRIGFPISRRYRSGGEQRYFAGPKRRGIVPRCDHRRADGEREVGAGARVWPRRSAARSSTPTRCRSTATCRY